MRELIRRLTWPTGSSDIEPLLTHEWLVTNGLGGYASGTVSGVLSRGFHGYLIAAQASPLGRTMMLNDLVEFLELPDGKVVQLGGEEREGEPLKLHGADFLRDRKIQGTSMGGNRFRVDMPRLLELWRQGRLKLDTLVSGQVKLTT